MLYSAIDGHPTSHITGTESDTFKRLWRPYRSPDGRYWGFRANAEFFKGGATLFVGRGTVGEMVIIKDGPAPWSPGHSINTVDHQMGLRNDGSFAFGAKTSDDAGQDPNVEYQMFFNGSDFEVIAQQGDAIPDLPGATLPVFMLETHILDDGRLGFVAINADGLPQGSDTIAVLGDSVIAQEGVTVPAGQALGATEAWDAFAFDGFYHDAAGDNYILIGDLEGSTATDAVVTVNGAVVIQEGQILPGAPGVIVGGGFTGIREGAMMSNGDWFARGGAADGRDWVVRNGTAAALTDTPIFPGATEMYDDPISFTETFFMQAGNNHGDYVIGGTTDHADPSLAAVVVLNNAEVVVRAGDPVDLDGNGLADDDAFIDTFDPDQSFLTDDLVLYFNARLRNGLGEEIEQAFMRHCLAALAGDFDDDCDVDGDDYAQFEACFTGEDNGPIAGGCDPGDFDGDDDIDCADFDAFAHGWTDIGQSPVPVDCGAIPATSTWGLVAMALLLVMGGTVVLSRASS